MVCLVLAAAIMWLRRVIDSTSGYVQHDHRACSIMKEDNLLAVRRRKFAATTDSDHDFVVYSHNRGITGHDLGSIRGP